MIKIIKGTYGMRCGSHIEPITAGSDPILLEKEKEERLVRLGVAVYVNTEYAGNPQDDETQQPETGAGNPQDDENAAELPDYNEDMKLSELKEIAKVYGIDASAMRTKKEVIEAMDAVCYELPAIDADALVE